MFSLCAPSGENQDFKVRLRRMDNNVTGAVPSGIGLKAAYLLRQELQKHQGLPSIEQLAMILEDTLRYPGAVMAMRDEEDFHGTSHTRDGVCEFNAWANDVLVGDGPFGEAVADTEH